MDDETNLINRAIHGDEQAVAELFAHYRDRLRRIVAFRLHPAIQARVDADDVLQEAYLNAVQRIRHIFQDSPRSYFIWLRMIVNQTLTEIHRRHLGVQMRAAGREVAGSRQTSDSTSFSLSFHLIGHLTTASQAALRKELLERIDAGLATMNELDREVLAMRHFEELSNSEIAEALGITEQAAAMRYIRALGRLRDILEAVPGFFDG